MSTANLPPGAMPVGNDGSDPFLMPSTPSMSGENGARQRYGGFDVGSFSMFATGSPAQAKRALEAHIAETERRLQEASRIGQVLVGQRKELADRLKEVESVQEDEVNPALKARLLELENEFNHVNRETARIFVGKNRVPSGDGPERDATEYGGVAHPSPSKAHAPSRKQRNQQSSRVNDLQLATDISAELLEQVRILQASLAEKDALLKDITAEKSHLEADLDVTRQRVKALDESEQRYKDANWALETQLHELTAEHQEATSREQRLNQVLMVSTSAKASLERDFEDLKLAHAKLAEDHTAVRKQHEAELTSFKKNATQDETQITGLHKKVEELTSQNKELAQAFAYRLGEQSRQVSAESAMSSGDVLDDVETPDDSPPGSPSKATPRHGALHEETTKSALNHAYRTIQNLKNQLHREKTEKIEYRRLLQDARDDLESKRPGVDSGKKRNSKKEQDIFKKPVRPDRLGEARSSREEIVLDESDDWEDHEPADTPSKRRTAILTTDGADKRNSVIESSTDNYATATENSDAFETANEKEVTTESDAFQTGNETLDGDSDATETETGTSRGRPGKRPGHAHRMSYQSTASTSADEFDENELKTPVQSQASKFKIRVNRGGAARRGSGREAAAGASQSFEDSPGNVSISSNNSTPMQGLSLANELEGLSDEESEEGTPTSSHMLSPVVSRDTRQTTPSKLRESSTSVEQFKPVMVDSGVMTEPWEPEAKSVVSTAAGVISGGVAGAAGFLLGRTTGSHDDEPKIEQKPLVDQRLSVVSDQENSQRLSTASSIEPITPALTDFPAPPVHYGGTSTVVSPTSEPHTATRDAPPALTHSTVFLENTEPVELPRSITPENIEKPEPIERIVEVERFIEHPPQVLTMFSTITQQDTAPVDAPVVRPSTATNITEGVAAGAGVGFLGGLLGRKKTPEPTTIAEDETSQPPRTAVMRSTATGTSTERLPLRQIEANAPPAPERKAVRDGKPLPKALAIETNNEATQTALSADDLDRLLRPSVDLPPARPAFVAATSSPRRSRELANTAERAQRRPGSAGSHRSRDRTPPPPLPMEAKQVIAAAALTTGGKPSSSASNAPPPLPAAFGAMGPPAMPASAMGSPHISSSAMGPPGAPASAYRNPQPQAFRPQTPQTRSAQSIGQSPVRNVTINAPRADTPSRSQVASPTRTRRSSVSSFASELDHRFNISSTAPYAGMFNDGQATDPRMIQAITNTMIGEYLYKYTRKAGSKEMSTSRHRRFFWVHPYTRTLYWSEQDPTTAGKHQLKAKSVQIEAVRIVTDDNPMPPGLHRKSLVVTTPGRTIKFTAPTSQRHETWSNALTYLLLKTGAERDAESATGDDAEEFNPSLAAARSQSRNTGRSRASISSYVSRGSTKVGEQSQSQHPTLRANSAQGIRSQSQNRASLSNRLSAIAGSLASRHSSKSLAQHQQQAQPDLEAHNPNDSAEDLRKVIEQQERDADRLENVRACCDGKHDVASLSRTARHSRQFSAKGHAHVHSHGAAPPPNSVSRASERR